jgi:Na+/pantothenate symporter
MAHHTFISSMKENFLLAAAEPGNSVLFTFLIYILGVFVIAWLSNKLLQNRNFLSEYFLGSRGLGVWAFALTLAATSSSGGSFMGFPAKIYSHGWVLALWIGSYMVVPICIMGLLGKRINQVARISGAITVPDILRDRFNNVSFGLVSVALIIFFMTFNLVAQFKAGSEILRTLLGPIDAFNSAVAALPEWFGNFSGLGADYMLCLVVFGVAVIVYTTYGGFHAVVWTDVMQGIVMLVGVIIMLPLAINQATDAIDSSDSSKTGMAAVTEEMAKMVPPRYVTIGLSLPESPTEDVQIPPGTWVSSQGKVLHGKSGRVFRTKQRHVFSAGAPVSLVEAIEIISPSDKRRSFEAMESQNKNDTGGVASNLEVRLVLNNAKVRIPSDYVGDLSKVELKTGILLPWEDQGTQRIANLYAITSEVESLKAGDELDAYVFDFIRTEDSFLKMEQNVYRSSLTEFPQLEGIEISSLDDGYYAYGAADEEIGSFVTAPGPHRDSTSGFLPLSLAISFFFMWAISGTGQPSNMVRLMAFKDTMTLRRSIFTVAMYYTMIYFPLVIIFCCARILLPGMEAEADRIMPQMAVTLTTNVGMGWLAGLLIAAPFAAVMSTVDSFLLMISSALVRDIYQRNMNPDATEKQIKKLSYIFTLVVGLGALIGAMNPPEFLQDIIVYTGSGLAAAFLAPVVYALYWPRSNHQGCIAAMIGGFGAHLSLYIIGFINGEGFTPYRPLELDPIIIGLFGSFIIGFIVTLKTAPPSDKVVKKYFYKKLEG